MPRPMGRVVDGACADLPLPPLGRVRLRPAARGDSRPRRLGAAVALWSLALPV
jgi:hypothetical protein